MMILLLIWFVGVLFFYVLSDFFGGIMGNKTPIVLILIWPLVILYRIYQNIVKK